MNGIVVAPQPRAAEAGAEVLRRGGNAFDAAVTVAFMQCAIDPFMCGVGGIGVAQVFDARRGEATIVDFYGRVGSRARADQRAGLIRRTPTGRTYVKGFANAVGYGSILIPGTVAGLAAIHERGCLPWRDLLQPAIAVLRDGFPLYAYIAEYFDAVYQYPHGDYFPPFEQFIRTTPDFAHLWLREDGLPRRVGDHLVNLDYADTLQTLADEGPDALYRGSLASVIAADFAAHDAPITADDLAACRANIVAPIGTDYRGYRVSTSPPGGITLLQALALLGDTDFAASGQDSPDALHHIATSLRIAFGERGKIAGDADRALLDRLLAPARLAELRRHCGAPASATRAVPDPPGTTHLTVADRQGNIVTLTHTLSLGSGVVTPGLGFQYNNGMASFDPFPGRPRSIAPGQARVTPMSPTIVFDGERPLIALGSPGSNAIISAITQTLINLLDFGLSPLEAVGAPRIHCEGGALLLETRTPIATARELAARGWVLNPRPFAYDTLQGRVQLIVREGERWAGAADPRRDGGVALVVEYAEAG
ncbi:MAG TPA: gamma-glutamyltransferase [Thermomicrobiales bacterium]|jgi:gamma-glutamyltranspeptidase/glutathione hydrolase